MEFVASLCQGRTAAAQCGLFTYKSVPVIFEPPCTYWRVVTDQLCSLAVLHLNKATPVPGEKEVCCGINVGLDVSEKNINSFSCRE